MKKRIKIKVILLLFFLILNIFAKGQNTKDSLIHNWSFGLCVSSNLSFQPSTGVSFAYPFNNTMEVGFGVCLNTKYRLSENTNILTGLAFDAINFEWKDYLQFDNLTYYSFGIPLLLETSKRLSNKLSLKFNFGFQAGIIPNAHNVDFNGIDGSGTRYDYKLISGIFMLYCTTELGFNYRVKDNVNLLRGPQIYLSITPLSYLYEYHGFDIDEEHIGHTIGYIKFLSFD